MVLARILNGLISHDRSYISFGARILAASQPLQLNQCTSYGYVLINDCVFFLDIFLQDTSQSQVGFDFITDTELSTTIYTTD